MGERKHKRVVRRDTVRSTEPQGHFDLVAIVAIGGRLGLAPTTFGAPVVMLEQFFRGAGVFFFSPQLEDGTHDGT